MRSILSATVTICAILIYATPADAGGASGPSLHNAAQNDDAGEVETLLASGVPIDMRDQDGATPLLVATRANAIAAATTLIAAGADVNAKDRIDDSPYLYAGARGHLVILKQTLLNGADLTSVNRFGGTALIPAAERGHVETVQLLITAGIEVDHVNRLGWTALLEAIILGDGGPRHVQVVDLLLQAGADPNLPDAEGVTPLRHSRQRGFREIAAKLTDAGAIDGGE